MKNSKNDLIIFGIVMVFIFFSGNLDQNTRLIITGILIVVIIISRVISMKKRDTKEVEKK